MLRRFLYLSSLAILALILGLVAPVNSAPAPAPSAQAHVAQLSVDGAIGPATTDYLANTMEDAREMGARTILIRLDTPGGLDAATREIIQRILASPIPVITWVTPSGARAASAGTYILYASHIAAMTPSTTLGAATPIQIGGKSPDQKPQEEKEEASTDDDDQAASTAMERKVINDSVAYIRGLAHRHDRNAEWAEQAVRQAATLTAEEARVQNVVDIVATDIEDLLAQSHGRLVQMAAGPLQLQLEGLPVVNYDPSWRNRLLALITNPQVAYILLLIGIYGLIFEGYSPGAMVPGVVGVISLLTALYALQVLPVNYAGLALILVGAALIVSEAFVPSFGVLGIGGVIALVTGSIMLMDTDIPGMMISSKLIGAIAAVSSLIVLGIILMVGRSLRIPRPTSNQALVGRIAYVAHEDEDGYQARIDGELWRATSDAPLKVGQRVRILAQQGLTLMVEKTEENSDV
jgi:membrane-bound serine protease (ClpP class)